MREIVTSEPPISNYIKYPYFVTFSTNYPIAIIVLLMKQNGNRTDREGTASPLSQTCSPNQVPKKSLK